MRSRRQFSMKPNVVVKICIKVSSVDVKVVFAMYKCIVNMSQYVVNRFFTSRISKPMKGRGFNKLFH